MLENLVTQEQLDEMVKMVWDKLHEEMEKNVVDGIRQELRHNVYSAAHKMVSAKIRGVLEPMIEAKMKDLIVAAEKIVESHFKRIEETALVEVERKCAYYADNVFDQYAKQLADHMKTAALTMVRERRKEISGQ